MKKLSLLMLTVITSGLHAYSVENLEQAIKQSDTKGVQKFLEAEQIPLDDQRRLLMLADDIIQQRRTKYESHFLKGSSLSVLFELSKEKIMVILGSIGLFVTTTAINTLVSRHYRTLHTATLPGPYGMNINIESTPFENAPCVIAGVIGISATVGTILKHFYDVKTLYNNSIEIKQLICKATISTND